MRQRPARGVLCRAEPQPAVYAHPLSIMARLAPLALFFSGLYTRLRRAEGQDGTLAGAVFAAGMIVAPLTPLVEMIEGHLLLGLAAAGGDVLVTRNFDGMTPTSFALSGFPQAVVLVGAGALILAHRAGPRWLGWFSVVLAIFSLIGTGTLIMSALFFLERSARSCSRSGWSCSASRCCAARRLHKRWYLSLARPQGCLKALFAT